METMGKIALGLIILIVIVLIGLFVSLYQDNKEMKKACTEFGGFNREGYAGCYQEEADGFLVRYDIGRFDGVWRLYK